jgi:hypothetical protein
LQYRIEKILTQHILFTGINNLLDSRILKLPTQYIQSWDEAYKSEECLPSLHDFLQTPVAESFAPFIAVLAEVLDCRTESSATAQGVAKALKPHLKDTWPWWAMSISLLLGFAMTLVGYVGCFTIVQGSSSPLDTYIWLGSEAGLALT